MNRILLLCLVIVVAAATGYTTKKALAPIIAVRLEYVSLEKSLWQYLSQPTKNDEAKQLKKVFETHRNVVNSNFTSEFDFDPMKYSILVNHYEWTDLEENLVELDGLFMHFRGLVNLYLDGDYDKQAILELCNDALHENKDSIDIPDLIEKMHNVMVRQTLYYRAMLVRIQTLFFNILFSFVFFRDDSLLRDISILCISIRGRRYIFVNIYLSIDSVVANKNNIKPAPH